MAWAYKRGARWYAGFRDRRGRRRARVLRGVKNKTEAKRIAVELEAREGRMALGLERPVTDDEMTVMALLDWWLEHYSRGSPSEATDRSTIHKHLPGTELATTRVDDPDLQGVVIRFLSERARVGRLKPKTVNNLRGYLHVAFSRAREQQLFRAENPITPVPRLRIPRRSGGGRALSPDHARAVIEHVSPAWRDLFATAVYTGMRKGELFALRKDVVDLKQHRLHVCASHGRDTTKGGHDDWIPIPEELIPYLRRAIKASRSELVFPGARGMHNRDTKLAQRLRSALRRAGIVEGWDHKCRRRGCRHIEHHDNADLRECPKCGFKLWPVGVPPGIRFHDLRHTTATLLLESGCDMAAVQKILRHSDPRLTTETYGHLSDDYLREQINRMRLR